MRRYSKRTVVVVASIVLAVAGIGTAYAYWTAGGSGTGTAATGTSTPIVAVQGSTVTNLRPGGTAQTLSGTFTNAAANGPVYVATVTASIASVVKAGGAPAGACTVDDYVLASASMDVNAEIPTGTAQGAWTGATLRFNNTGANQDGCKGATVNLAYAIA